MASSPINSFVKRSSSIGDSSYHNGYTKERTNTSDSGDILSPSNSKDDFDSIADSQEGDDRYEYDDDNNLEGSGIIGPGMLLEALAPGESSSPSRGNKVAGEYDLCGSMYKRRGGFGRNKENNW
jgi:hypothetical protein